MVRDFRSVDVARLRGGRTLDIVAPARVEQHDATLLEEFFQRFDLAFDDLVPGPVAAAGIRFRDLMIPYDPVCL